MDLIVALLERANWGRAKAYLNPEMMGKRLAPVAEVIDKMYADDPALLKIEPENLRTAFFKARLGLKLSEITAYNEIFDRVRESVATVSSKSFDSLLETLIVAEAMAEVASEAATGLAKPEASALDKVETLIEKYNNILLRSMEPEDVFVTVETLDAPPTSKTADVFRFPIREMDRAAGPIDQGDFVWIAARMEIGKSTLVAQCVASWAPGSVKKDRPILWVNNEERSEKLFRRVMQSFFNITTSELLTNFDHYRTLFAAAIGNGRLLITKQGEHNSVREIDALCAKFKPCLIVGDQWDKIAGFGKAERDDLRLGFLANWGRKLAAKWGPVIAVSQLDFMAEGLRFPSMANMRGSKVDKAAEADLIVTIGAENRTDPSRGFSFEKNKLDGANDDFRHDKFELILDAPRARFLSPK